MFGKPLLDSIVAMLRDASVPSERVVCAVCNFRLPASARATATRFERYHFAISYGARRFGSRIKDRERFVRIQTIRKRMSTGETRSHSYLSLNGSLRPHRLMLALWLTSAGHLEKGLVSFPAVDGQSVKRCLALPSSLYCRHPRGQDLVRMLGRLTSRLPLHVDRPLPLDRMSSLPRIALNAYEDVTAWPYEQSYFSIVTESEFCTGNRARFTEKICKPIVNLHPFILVGSPGMLAELRRLGFQTFQPFIDESYDAIRDPWSRLEAVFRQIDALCRLSLRELDDWYRALLPRLLHNRRQFFVQGRREAYRMRERLTDILVEGC